MEILLMLMVFNAEVLWWLLEMGLIADAKNNALVETRDKKAGNDVKDGRANRIIGC